MLLRGVSDSPGDRSQATYSRRHMRLEGFLGAVMEHSGPLDPLIKSHFGYDSIGHHRAESAAMTRLIWVLLDLN